MKKFVLLLVSMHCIFVHAQNQTYYISPEGSDANTGFSQGSAWQSVSKVNSIDFQPGDKILFKGQSTFSGSLQLVNTDRGTAENPIIISSYGTGKAIIDAGAANGVFAYNVGAVEIRNVAVRGNGAGNNNSSGLNFYMDQTTADLAHIVVDSVEASGFGKFGISIGSWGTTKGYHNVKILRSSAHDNGRAGITSYAEGSLYVHRNFYVGYCKAFRNTGRIEMTQTNTGSGIALSGIDGATIEFSEAYENGQYNGKVYGGPMGIWFYDVKNGVIQFCESHHNMAGKLADGGGFDLDGGCQNSVIQYCYSHENEGAGFAMLEYGSSNSFRNNTIRYNISQGDGRKNNEGGLAFWASDADHKIIDCQAYNNTIYTSNQNIISGTPAGFKVYDQHITGLKIRNNIFYATAGVNFTYCNTGFDTSQVLFQNNNYFSSSNTPRFIWASTPYYSLSAWKGASHGQETLGSLQLGTTIDPMLISAGTGGTINPAEGGDLTKLAAYKLQTVSPMINAGLSMRNLFNVEHGVRDFYNNQIALRPEANIGAHELRGSSVTFSGKVLLQGAYNPFTGTMNNTLNALGILKVNASAQPYNQEPFNYRGTELAGSHLFVSNPDIIDWVLIEIRTASNPLTVVARKAALLKQDGTIISSDSAATKITFEGIAPGSYYVSIRHRNHLGIRSAVLVDFSDGKGFYDFTQSGTACFQNLNYTATVQKGNVWLMRGGNANANSNVKFNGPANDQDRIQNVKMGGSISLVLSNQYSLEDINLDGKVKANGPGNDTDFLLNGILNGSTGSVYVEQL
ncbi:hypothetical protein EXU57_20665 [Segetibacter sp. 3557_3]|nr:right-handed parallel beta-helix repeat-containing protein [Segetibacter sp. 3557_3]TDH20811.1 hypothetical protein EXU57_20665 [Segetibacter sp. 3557_3]